MKSPLWRPDHEVFFKACIELMLADGTMTLGCLYCDYTDTKVGRIRMHQNYQCMANAARREKVAKPKAAEKKVVEKNGMWSANPQGKAARDARSAGTTGPPPAADDILAALESALQPFAGEDKETKKALATMTTERDHWRNEYKALSAKMTRIQELLKKKGIMG